MKPFFLAFSLAASTLLLGRCGLAADKTENSVAFRTTDNRLVSTVANGGLGANGAGITSRSTFVLIDLNGGELTEGDAIQIKWQPSGTKPTFWHEGETSIDRIGGKPTDACNFKINLKPNANKQVLACVVLQTLSGKFVSVSRKNAPLAVTDTGDKAATFEIVVVPPADDVKPASAAVAAPLMVGAPAPAPAFVPAPVGDGLPTLFLIGDSTVNNGTPGQKGWGSVIGDYFDPAKIHVSNRARGGRSSRTFLSEGLWDKVLAEVKPGDWVLMQFGHNDGGKPEGVYPNGRASLRGNTDESREVETKPGQKEVVHSYGWYLRRFISDTKAKGATPVVLSLIPRNDWKDGHVSRALGSYGGWAKEAAQASGATFVDLNALVADRYDVLGQDAVKAFFPNEHTHTNEAGARLNAQSVVAGLKTLPNNPFGAYFNTATP